MVIERSGEVEQRYPIAQRMGGKNVFYSLTALEPGWSQVLPTAYDVRRQEWFGTTASAVRHFGDRCDEALYWKERPLTFNTSCFSRHVQPAFEELRPQVGQLSHHLCRAAIRMRGRLFATAMICVCAKPARGSDVAVCFPRDEDRTPTNCLTLGVRLHILVG